MAEGPRRRAARRLTAGLAGITLVAGCGVLPEPPPPLPDTFVPEADPSPVTDTMPVGPDGFTVAERVAVRIWAVNCEEYVNGSAWILDDSTVVTNRHVVENATEIELSTYDGRRFTASASHLDSQADLALVSIDGTFDSDAAAIADAGPEVGDMLTVAGYPEGNALESRSGALVDVLVDPLEESALEVYQVAVQTQHGNSGSPVVNNAGEVVGVLYAGSEIDQSWAVTLESLQEFLSDESRRLPNVAQCD